MERSEQPDPNASQLRQAKFRLWPRRWRYRGLLVCVFLLMVSGSATWFERERIVGNLIDNYLAENGVAARYDLVEITPARQVIANLVVGNPAAPDLTAERVVIELGLGFVGPAVGQVKVEQARVFGTFTGGKLSFGKLDPLVFTGSKEPAALPKINVALRDARMRIDSDFGVIAAKLDGAGRLDDGFAGTLAVTAPGIGTADCRAQRATMFGALTTAKGKPEFAGPIRLASLDCGGAKLADADVGTVIVLAETLDEASGKFAISARALSANGTAAPAAARVTGQASAALSGKGAVLEHDVTLSELALPYAMISKASAKGTCARLLWAQGPEAAMNGAAKLRPAVWRSLKRPSATCAPPAAR